MKKGDKIYCIKNLEKTHYKSIEVKDGWSDNMTDDELNDFLNNMEKENSIKFQKGKSYTIKSMLSNEITLIDINDSTEFTTLEIVNDYFVSEKQYRKMKLEKLSDINFVNFLNKMKK